MFTISHSPGTAGGGEKHVQQQRASKFSFLTGKYFAYYLIGSKRGWESADMPEGTEESRVKVEGKALNFLGVARW